MSAEIRCDWQEIGTKREGLNKTKDELKNISVNLGGSKSNSQTIPAFTTCRDEAKTFKEKYGELFETDCNNLQKAISTLQEADVVVSRNM